MMDDYFPATPPTGTAPLAPARAREHEPADPAERFAWRVTKMMNSSGRDRCWCRQRVREMFPDEFEAHRQQRDEQAR